MTNDKRVTDPFWPSCMLSQLVRPGSMAREHKYRHNHDIVHRYLVGFPFASRSPRHLWRPHTTKPTAMKSCLCPGLRPWGATISAAGVRTTLVLKAIPEKKVNENKEAMWGHWGETHIFQDVCQPYMVSFQPNQRMGDILLSLT